MTFQLWFSFTEVRVTLLIRNFKITNILFIPELIQKELLSLVAQIRTVHRILWMNR